MRCAKSSGGPKISQFSEVVGGYQWGVEPPPPPGKSTTTYIAVTYVVTCMLSYT